MSQTFSPGDFLVFQLEAGYALLRVLAVDNEDGDCVWHIAAYSDFFLDVDSAEVAANDAASLVIGLSHVALTNRAFESTQVAKIANFDLAAEELAPLESWRKCRDRTVSDRSIRLMLGLR